MIWPLMDPVTLAKVKMVNGSTKEVQEYVHTDISPDVLEESMCGSDRRPFDSEAYLSAPFHMDFCTLLNTQPLSLGVAAVAAGEAATARVVDGSSSTPASSSASASKAQNTQTTGSALPFCFGLAFWST